MLLLMCVCPCPSLVPSIAPHSIHRSTSLGAGSLHLAPNKVLVDTIIALGQRAVVGKVG
jgi:hypothetical protein